MLLNAKTLTDLKKGFNVLYLQGYSAITPDYQKIAMEVPSNGPAEVYGWLANLPRMREWLGDRVINNLKGASFEIKNKKFELTVGVKADDIEDDKLGQYKPLIEQLGNAAAGHPDELTFALLATAFTALCYDGQYFVDTDHPVLDKDGVSQSVSNSGGGSGSPWFLMDVKKAIKPLIFQKRRDYRFIALDNPEDQNVFMKDEFLYGVDGRGNAGFGLWQLVYGSKQTLDDTNYSLAQANLAGRMGDYAKPLRLEGNLLVVGPSNLSAAKKLVTASTIAGGGDNIHKGTAEILVVPELG